MPDTELLKMKGCTEKFTFNPKEGIDNPLMVHTEESTARPRLCVLKKEEGESFGFHLCLEWTQRGHIIRNVLSGGVAARCGLQDGDRLLEVNNVYVDDIPHPEVAKRIRLSGHQLCLLVLDGQEYEKACGHNLHHLVRAHKSPDLKPPRLCHIVKDPASGLGINFIPVGAEKGCFSVNVLPGGAAEKSGVQKGDRLLWLNGAAVSHLTHSALSRMMKQCCTSITVLVMDSESEKKYSKLKMPILPCMAVPHKLPYSSRKLHLLSGPEGYGFLLRFEKAPSGRTSHVLRKVDAGSPAEKAGMRDGEVLLEVNGESVELLQHDDIVKKVRESGQHTSLTTITPQGQEFYTQLGLSPLLFCENYILEMDGSEGVQAAQVDQQKDSGLLGFGCVPLPPGEVGPHVGQVVLEEQNLEDGILLLKNAQHNLSSRVMEKIDYDTMKQVDAHTEEEDTELSRL
ncbi:NHERF family PDZ scaffold protein 4b isoform X1 [Entelurus aequoreus]|uniref:NHERF family PDZ scaffold protein 4b isoform X1 n=3 Tax=Entelurus aequoreus TaxID=161455 RepID=UPI002B1D6C73|nr:NHERF family PDZ scaffold protein 4b isoform X1 [Entelurus aequoreus]